MRRTYAVLLTLVWLSACASTGIPERVTPVQGFELQRYLGRWYELARLDHSFERGLSDVTAHYSLREDGGVRVVNRGYAQEQGRWKSAEGRAYFVGKDDVAHLKVSFFGPFYGSYIVFELDSAGYQYALVSGPNTGYLWLLARQPRLDEGIKRRLLARAREAGFATEGLIFVDQGRPQPATPAP